MSADTKKPIGSLSLDLDNQWSYMKTHGDAGWESFPSYLDRVVPMVLKILTNMDQKITFFIVGQDAALDKNREAIASIAGAGHDIGNHSFHHEQWLHLRCASEIDDELALAEEQIERVTGFRPSGFRGPGFCLSREILDVLAKRGYLFDASTFPTYLGPIARAYYFLTAKMSADEMAKRKALFGSVHDGLRPLKPYRWDLAEGSLLEIPVTTIPWFKVPFHLSYLLYLSGISSSLAMQYFQAALRLCKLTETPPSILLHPLDFLGGDEVGELSFFPGMGLAGAKKRMFVVRALTLYRELFHVVPMGEQALSLSGPGRPLKMVSPCFHKPI